MKALQVFLYYVMIVLNQNKMKPHEKAKALIERFKTAWAAEDLALIAVNEIIEAIDWHYYETPNNEIEYWTQVKQEIEKL